MPIAVAPLPSKRLSQSEIRANCVEFANHWADETRERGEAQTFWNELMACFGVNRRRAGAMFEYPARRASTGQQGFIDVLWPGVFLAEHKSSGKLMPAKQGERSAAEEQAFDYLHGGTVTDPQMPRYVATSDFRNIQITDLEAAPGSPDRTFTFLTIDLPVHYEKLLFLADGHTPEPLGAHANQVDASMEAVKLMGALYEAILADTDADLAEETENPDDEDEATEQASVLLTRLLFLMAGDDNGLWAHDLFSSFVRTRTMPDGSDLGAQLTALFEVLNTPERRRSRHLDPELAAFPYVNGGVFADRQPVQFFTKAIRDALLACCDFNWTRISPAIFGSLFQAIKSKEARHSDGEHYTSETNILKTIGPLFLDDLRARLDRTNTVPGLRALWNELGTYRYLDPACGCGNFLVIAYREMRALELDLIVKLRDLAGDTTGADSAIGRASRTYTDQFNQEGLFGGDLRVRLDQFAGIELNWWPAKIAETAMFLVDHQANRRMETTLGLAPQRLPIDIEATIHHGNALTTDWADVCPATRDQTVYVFGNPPFLGDDRDKRQLAELQAAWGHNQTSRLDYVTSWHAKTLAYLRDRQGEWGFVTTNSITQGDQPRLLFRPIFDAGWRIKFAHRTFKWKNEGRGKDTAAVHVIIVGFTRTPGKGQLFDYPDIKGDPVSVPVSTAVNAYLVDGPNVIVDKTNTPLNPQMGAVSYGNKPADGGHLLVKTAEELAALDPVARKYIRPYVGAQELLHGRNRWCLWLVDMDPADMTASSDLRRRVQKVREFRADSKADTTSEYAHHHLFRQFGFCHTGPYVCIPRHVSETRRYFTVARLAPDVIASDAVFTADDPDGFVFAIASSSMYVTWQKAIGGRIKSDIRFASTLTWNTLPLPEVSAALRAKIIAAGQGVEAARALHPERTLAQHYEPLAMDPALVAAHDKLDAVVDVAFGAPRRCRSEVERQRILFERYAELTAGLTDAPAKARRGRRR